MPRESANYLTRREKQIMEILHRRSEASVAELVESIPDPVTESGVRVFLKSLEKKGRIRRRKVGRKYIYAAAESRTLEGRSALRKVLGTFFDDSVTRAVSSYLSDPAVELNDDELERITRLIEDARRRSD